MLQNGLLGASWEALGGSWELLEHLGSLLEAPDGSEERLLVVLEGSWKHLGASWSALGDLLEALVGLLGASWSHFRSIWRLFGRYFGAWKAFSTRFAEIMKNHQKPCKVLQTSRFGGLRRVLGPQGCPKGARNQKSDEKFAQPLFVPSFFGTPKFAFFVMFAIFVDCFGGCFSEACFGGLRPQFLENFGMFLLIVF